MKMRGAFVVAVGVVALGCSGTSSPTPTPAPSPHVFVLSGRVTDISGSALAGSSVTVTDGVNASRSTTSDTTGAFRLTDMLFGGFTVRVRHDGYDSVFQAVRLFEDTALDIQMMPAARTLAGTWTGTFTAISSGLVNGPSFCIPNVTCVKAIPETALIQAGASIASNFTWGTFSGVLRDPSAIASTTAVTGTITASITTSDFKPCNGTGDFTGTVSWTSLIIVAPVVTSACAVLTDVTLSLVRQQ